MLVVLENWKKSFHRNNETRHIQGLPLFLRRPKKLSRLFYGRNSKEMEYTPHFTGKGYKAATAVGDIYTCMYHVRDETVSETWEVIEPKKCGWVSIVPIQRKVANNKGEVREEIRATAESMTSFCSTARTGPTRVDLDGNLHMSLILGSHKTGRTLNRIISSA